MRTIEEAQEKLKEATEELQKACNDLAQAWQRVAKSKRELNWYVNVHSRRN